MPADASPDPAATPVLDRIHERGWLLATIVVSLACYLPSLHAPFFSDDFLYFVDNEKLQRASLARPADFLAQRLNPYEYLPLRDLSYRIDLELFGAAPWGFRLHNFLLYALSVAAAWLLARALFRLRTSTAGDERHSPRAAPLVAAALFAAHPAHVESVAWISGRKDLLSGVLTLAALALLARALTAARLAPAPLAGAAGLFLLALAGKSTAVSGAAVAALLAAMIVGRSAETPCRRRATLWIAATLPFALLAVVWLRMSMAVGESTLVLGGAADRALAGSAGHLRQMTTLLGRLGGLAIWPYSPRLIYDLSDAPLARSLSYAGGLVLFAAAALGAGQAIRRGSPAGFGVAAFVLFVLPYLQIVPFSTWSPVSDRFLFLAVFGLACILVEAADRLPRRIGRAALGLLLASWWITAAMQARVWSSVESLVTQTAERSPTSATAQRLYIESVLLPAGRLDAALAAAGRVRNPLGRAALEQELRATSALARGDVSAAVLAASGLEHLGGGFETHLLLGRIAELGGDAFQACRHYDFAARLAVSDALRMQARTALGRVREAAQPELDALRAAAARQPAAIPLAARVAALEMELFLLDDAEAGWRRILGAAPALAAARYNLGLTLLRARRYREASVELAAAIDGGIASADAWNNLALARRDTGDLEGSERAFRSALTADPRSCDAAINLARLQLTRGEIGAARDAFVAARDRVCDPRYAPLIALHLDQVTSLLRE